MKELGSTTIFIGGIPHATTNKAADEILSLREQVDELTAECNRLREFEVTAQTADEELKETKDLQDRLAAVTAEREILGVLLLFGLLYVTTVYMFCM